MGEQFPGQQAFRSRKKFSVINFLYEPHLNSSSLSSVSTVKWTYDRKDYPNGAKISAFSSISRYSANGKGHKYIAVKEKDSSEAPCYVVITTGSIAQ